MSIDLDRDLRHDTFDGVGDPGVSAADELAGYRAAFAALAATFDRARRGDLETRVPLLPAVPDAERVRWSANHLLDLVDAFTREAGASLTAASEGRFHRAFLAAGMPGSFGEGAQIVDAGRIAMRSAAERLAATQTERLHLADSFETVVLGASEQVAAASTELGATASTLAIAASDAADRAQAAGSTISSLESSSNQIRQVVDLIHQVTAQTKLLALNAAIEAARAGEAGKGFNVVATEVKNLAQQAAVAAQQIETEVSGVAEATRQAGRVIDELRSTVVEIADQVQAISIAVEGQRGHGGSDPLGSDDFTGLAQLAELLRAEVTTFLGVLRG